MGIKFLYGVIVNGDSTFTDNIGVGNLNVNGTLRVDNQGVGPINIPPQPDIWITINVNGNDYVVPAYLPGP